ncbi:MAG: response regulator [Spirochaetaceae bacterium]|jgi:putative two-component system response regulator|nr:response regulator [Spirochaetaceae bacterium]
MEDVKETIFLVDDNSTNLMNGMNLLNARYNVFTAPSAKKMFSLMEKHRPDLILMDIEMPEMNGYEAIKILKSNPETRDIPVIFLTGKNDVNSELEGLNAGALDYISKPFVPPLLLKRIEVHLLIETQKHTMKQQREELKNFNENLQQMVDEKTKTVVELQDSILKTVADIVECRDDITGGHIERTQRGVGLLVELIKDHPCYRSDMSEWNIKLLLQSSQLHDVGKIAISDRILQKPGCLTKEEFEEMKKHTVLGVQIIEKIEATTKANDFLKYAKIFAGTHHERWDGSGYPGGLKGEMIPLQSRIMAIADVYDALTSERPYKKAFPHEEAVRIITEGRGTQFDPVLTDMFIESAGLFKN